MDGCSHVPTLFFWLLKQGEKGEISVAFLPAGPGERNEQLKKQRKFWIQLASKLSSSLQAASATHPNSHIVFGALLAFTWNLRQERFLNVLNPIKRQG